MTDPNSAAPAEIPLSSPPAVGEELPGPPDPAPVSRAERIPILDVIRGFALLGILLMNVPAFSGPTDLDSDPTLVGTHNGLNISAWVIRMVFFEGKMRAAFSMLFGAGVILLTDRAEARGLGARVGDIFTRRNMWLMVFGMAHAYFLWFGDILYWYGMMALLFLYPFRRAKPRLLFVSGIIALVLVQIPMTLPLLDEVPEKLLLESASSARRAGKALTKQQSEALAKKAKAESEEKQHRSEDIKQMRSGYLEILRFRASLVKYLETDYLYYLGFADALGMMFIGMALLRTGFLIGSKPNRTYIKTALICYPIAITAMGFGAWTTIQAHFSDVATDLYIHSVYQPVRLAGALANVSVVILVCKLGWFRPLTRRLAAVGQTALSNYILTSLLCSVAFNGYGLRLYGRLEYYQLFYVVVAVWTVNLIVSPLWLKHFQYGPLEWLWRSLTYWKRQPMRLLPQTGLGHGDIDMI